MLTEQGTKQTSNTLYYIFHPTNHNQAMQQKSWMMQNKYFCFGAERRWKSAGMGYSVTLAIDGTV
jgi:hypothetical protein